MIDFSSPDYIAGVNDTCDEIVLGISKLLGDTPVDDNTTLKLADIGALIESRRRQEPARKPDAPE